MMPKLQLMVTRKDRSANHDKHKKRVVRHKVVDFSSLERYLN